MPRLATVRPAVRRVPRACLAAALLAPLAVACPRAAARLPAAVARSRPDTATFANPVVASRDAGDPSVVRYGGAYYFTATLDPGGGVWVWRSPTLTGLDAGTKVKVWTAPPAGPLSRQIWAPELQRLRGRWYLYFTASDGVDANHRQYVLAALTDDPQGPYAPPARVDPAFERYAIDGAVLALPDGRLYFLFCAGGLWIAPMDSPTHVRGPAVRFAAGSEAWEHGWRKVSGRWERDAGYWIEAPQPLVRGGRVFVVYSAGHTATPHYALGLLELTGRDPLDPAAWTKRRAPLLGPYEGPEGSVYTPGHNSLTTSPDGTEDWLVYHAKDAPADASGGNEAGRRTVRVQPFAWDADGTPRFGHPVPSGVRLRKPSGE